MTLGSALAETLSTLAAWVNNASVRDASASIMDRDGWGGARLLTSSHVDRG